MIKKNHFGYEIFECSNCGNQVNEFDDYCQICGKTFDETHEFENYENKFKAIDYSEGDFNDNTVIIATLQNSKIGINRFIVPNNSQIAMRVKYYVINGNTNFLEDGLVQDKLIDLSQFEKIEFDNDNEYFVEKTLLQMSELLQNLKLIIKQRDLNPIYLQLYKSMYLIAIENNNKICDSCIEMKNLDLPYDCLSKPVYCVKDCKNFEIINLYEELKILIQNNQTN